MLLHVLMPSARSISEFEGTLCIVDMNSKVQLDWSSVPAAIRSFSDNVYRFYPKYSSGTRHGSALALHTLRFPCTSLHAASFGARVDYHTANLLTV